MTEVALCKPPISIAGSVKGPSFPLLAWLHEKQAERNNTMQDSYLGQVVEQLRNETPHLLDAKEFDPPFVARSIEMMDLVPQAAMAGVIQILLMLQAQITAIQSAFRELESRLERVEEKLKEDDDRIGTLQDLVHSLDQNVEKLQPTAKRSQEKVVAEAKATTKRTTKDPA